jgi:predicted DNA-binding transcriptional regulator YafY
MGQDWDSFEDGRRRDASEASESVARKIWLLMELLRHRQVRFTEYEALHSGGKRSFQRDLQQLRTIGKTSGFTISQVKDGVVNLTAFDATLRRLDEARPPLLRLLAELARTLGEPIQGEIGAIAQSAPEGEVFLHVQAPKLVEGSQVAKVYEKLKDAWASPAGRASVRFRYRGPSAATPEERTVDPYRVIVRSGRYYLVGYDVKRRDWRIFALDSVVGLPVKAGTVRTERPIPEAHGNADVLGFIKGTARAVDVTVEFSPRVAASATSRIWKHDQRLEKLSGGRARLTLSVGDPGEVVRWAFGFGADARVVSPPAAVRAARDLARELLEAHDQPAGSP